MARAKKPTRGDAVIEFVEKLKITTGSDRGKPFRLRAWQKRFINDVYDPVSKEGRRIVRRAVFSVARKQGKSELAAALILVHLIGPECEPNGEIYSAANDSDQAAIVFKAASRIVAASPTLQKYLKVIPSTKRIIVTKSGIKAEGSFFKALSAEAGTKHGLNPSFIVYDELAQTKNRELFDTLTTSQGARSEPLFLTISTQNNDPQHVLSEMIDDALSGRDPTIVCHLYAADDDCDLLDETQWLKANPAMGDFRSIDELRVMANRAARLPSEEASFRLLYLNQRVSLHGSLISMTDWKARAGKPATNDKPAEAALVKGEKIYLALDMSLTTDLTALIAVSAGDKSRVACWFWKPKALIEEHTRRDHVRYDLCEKQGTLIAAPGREIDPRLIGEKIIELMKDYDVRVLAYDRHRMKDVIRHFEDCGISVIRSPDENELTVQPTDGLLLHPIGQGSVGFSPCVASLESSVLSERLVHPDNQLLNMCMMNAQTIADPAGNRKLDKEASRFRIDGAVALAMALRVKDIDRPEIAAVSPFENPEYVHEW